MRLVNWRSLAIGAAGLGLAACGDDVAVVQPVTLTPSQTAIQCTTGQTIAIGASLNPAQSNATFQYTGTGTPANAFTVTGNGPTATLVCANAGTGSVTIAAGGQTVTVPVTVTQSPSQFNVLITPSTQSVAVGGTATFSGTILNTTGTGTVPAVRFRSAQPNIATVDSVSGVARGVAVGVATILAFPAGSPNNAAAGTLTVLGPSQIVANIVANPASVTLQTGQTQQVTATVNLQPNAPANTPRTVTYSTQNPAVATVSTTGTITGVGNGSTSIIVRSTADTAQFVAVPVTVRAQTPVRVTISSVTTENTNQLVDITQPIGTAATNQGANAQNQTGSIFVTLSLDPGDATLSRVDLFLAPAATPNDTTNRVCSQVFTAALADAYRLALQNGSADVQPITCPINLAAFNEVTGVPNIRNGQAVLRARVVGAFPGTTGGASQIAQFTQQLTINNLSGFFVRVLNTPDSAQRAVNAQGTAQGLDGRNWVAGTLAFRVLPVSFEAPATGNNATPQITVSLIDPGAYGTPTTRTLSVNAAATGATVIQFPGRPATRPTASAVAAAGIITENGDVAPRSFNAANQNIDGWSSGPNGTTISITGVGFNTTQALQTLGARLVRDTTSTAQGQVLTLATGAQNQIPGSFTLNIDNLAPQPAQSFNVLSANFTPTNVGFVGFLGSGTTINNTGVGFANRQFGPTYAGGVQGTNADFGGVDRVTTTFVAQLNSAVSSLTAANIFAGGTTFTSGSQLAAANSNTAYSAVARFVDVLGNARNQLIQQGAIQLDPTTGQITGAGTAVSFGVDVVAPVLTSPNAATLDSIVNAANSAVANNDIQTQYQDDIGFGATPLLVLGQRQAREPDAPSTAQPATYCFTGITGGVATFNTQSTAQTGQACTSVAVAGVNTIPVSNTQTGQYTFSIVARDQAGNTSDTLRVRQYIDVVAPTLGGVSLPQVLTGNAGNSFTASAFDNLEVGTAYPQVAYSPVPAYGTGAFTLSYATSLTTVGRPFDNAFPAIVPTINLNIPSFIRSVTFTAAGGAPGTTGTGNLAQSLIAVITDAALAPGFQANQGSQVLPIPTNNIVLTNFGSTIFATGNQTSQINQFALTFDNGSAAFANQISLGGTTNAPTAGTFTVTSAGQTGAFINPFVRVELWYSQFGGPANYQRLTALPAGATTDNNNVPAVTGRSITASTSFTPLNTPLSAGVSATQSVQYNVVAVGVTAQGDALVSAPVSVTVIR